MRERGERADRGLGVRDQVFVACDVGEFAPMPSDLPRAARRPAHGPRPPPCRAPRRAHPAAAKACATADPIPPTAPVTRTPFPTSPFAEWRCRRAAPSRAWRDPVRLDVVAVELPAETRRARQRRCARRRCGGRLATRFHQIGSRAGLNTSRNVPCGIEASRWVAIWGSSWWRHRDVEGDARLPPRGATRSGRPTRRRRSCRRRSRPRPSGRGTRLRRTRSGPRRRERPPRSGRPASRAGRSTSMHGSSNQ